MNKSDNLLWFNKLRVNGNLYHLDITYLLSTQFTQNLDKNYEINSKTNQKLMELAKRSHKANEENKCNIFGFGVNLTSLFSSSFNEPFSPSNFIDNFYNFYPPLLSSFLSRNTNYLYNNNNNNNNIINIINNNNNNNIINDNVHVNNEKNDNNNNNNNNIINQNNIDDLNDISYKKLYFALDQQKNRFSQNIDKVCSILN